METHLDHVLCDTPELDSELLDDNTKVLGVLAADTSGQCILAKGKIDKHLAGVSTSLSKIVKGLEPETEESPVIILDTEETRVNDFEFLPSIRRQMLIKSEPNVTVVILKKL